MHSRSIDIQVLTGVKVSHSTQQRLVHRQIFALPQVEQAVNEMSVDGGLRSLTDTPRATQRMARLQGSEFARLAVSVHFSRIMQAW